MLRRTQAFFKVSPYILFVKELGKKGSLRGVRYSGREAVKQYRSLSASAKAALVKRANATTFPAAERYLRLAKRELKNSKTPIQQRQAALREKWAKTKVAQKPKLKPQAPKSAKRKIRKAGKKVKASK